MAETGEEKTPLTDGEAAADEPAGTSSLASQRVAARRGALVSGLALLVSATLGALARAQTRVWSDSESVYRKHRDGAVVRSAASLLMWLTAIPARFAGNLDDPQLQGITVVVAYLVIQALDGNVLVPLLFGEVVSLHPIAIIVAILVFGGLWGFWGVFFAIPLATLVNAVIRAWPGSQVTAQAA